MGPTPINSLIHDERKGLGITMYNMPQDNIYGRYAGADAGSNGMAAEEICLYNTLKVEDSENSSLGLNHPQ